MGSFICNGAKVIDIVYHLTCGVLMIKTEGDNGGFRTARMSNNEELK